MYHLSNPSVADCTRYTDYTVSPWYGCFFNRHLWQTFRLCLMNSPNLVCPYLSQQTYVLSFFVSSSAVSIGCRLPSYGFPPQKQNAPTGCIEWNVFFHVRIPRPLVETACFEGDETCTALSEHRAPLNPLVSQFPSIFAIDIATKCCNYTQCCSFTQVWHSTLVEFWSTAVWPLTSSLKKHFHCCCNWRVLVPTR